MIEYHLYRHLGPGLVILTSVEYGAQMFATGKLRKQKPCANCRREMQRGEQAFRTVNGNTMNRMIRVCTRCVPLEPEKTVTVRICRW